MMLDYRELPEDGIAFEQLVRELLICEGLDVHWTGVGPDGGRDLVVTEALPGHIAPFSRRWLVSCKHYANSVQNRSVGVNDVNNILDACKAVDATGFLLVCSTQPTAALVRRLDELARDGSLATQYWDGVELEKRLHKPGTLGLVHHFLPKSARCLGWTIYNTDSPSFWAANFRDYFLYLSSRTANTFPDLNECQFIIDRLETVPLPDPGLDVLAYLDKQYLRPRAIYFDNKHEQFYVFADYLVPTKTKPQSILSPADFNVVLQDCRGLHSDKRGMWYITYWDIRRILTTPTSDNFHFDHKSHYEPFMNNFRMGLKRGPWTLGDISDWY
ncbi:MAG: hypothetical protein BWY69_00815 [Planctomycetes bacterium ADurb.Bin401]|nr:MAG: hypothetical protein BWY69_00815 [Planctomycetes bacterium ADurb.Bin401]